MASKRTNGASNQIPFNNGPDPGYWDPFASHLNTGQLQTQRTAISDEVNLVTNPLMLSGFSTLPNGGVYGSMHTHALNSQNDTYDREYPNLLVTNSDAPEIGSISGSMTDNTNWTISRVFGENQFPFSILGVSGNSVVGSNAATQFLNVYGDVNMDTNFVTSLSLPEMEFIPPRSVMPDRHEYPVGEGDITDLLQSPNNIGKQELNNSCAFLTSYRNYFIQ